MDLADAPEGQHPAHPPAPRPHPGADVLPALLPRRRRRSRSGGRPPPRPRSRTGSPATSRPRSPRWRSASCPATVSFRDTPPSEWQIGSATIRAEAVTHRGPTLGYRITEGDTTLCYIPDHEPALGASLAELEPEWISGYDLARDADLLIHDCQYTDEEYPDHIGWGHSAHRGHADLRPASAPSGSCSSTTTRSTPTTSSTISHIHRPPALGGAGRRPRPAVEMGMEGGELEVAPADAPVTARAVEPSSSTGGQRSTPRAGSTLVQSGRRKSRHRAKDFPAARA